LWVPLTTAYRSPSSPPPPPQRKAELSGSGNELLMTAQPEDVSNVDVAAVGGMLAAVQQCLCQLTTPRFRQLLLIATSQRYRRAVRGVRRVACGGERRRNAFC
jgi:hypothetical protein